MCDFLFFLILFIKWIEFANSINNIKNNKKSHKKKITFGHIFSIETDRNGAKKIEKSRKRSKKIENLKIAFFRSFSIEFAWLRAKNLTEWFSLNLAFARSILIRFDPIRSNSIQFDRAIRFNSRHFAPFRSNSIEKGVHDHRCKIFEFWKKKTLLINYI